MEQELIDKILAELVQGPREEEIKRARSDYFALIQDLREDDPSYERLTACFLNWFVFDRPGDDGQGTPLQVFARREDPGGEERKLLACMAASIHSLFEVVRLESGALHLRDLFTLEALRVTERRRLAGIEPGDLLEARLLPLGEKLVFSAGAFVLHPKPAREVILRAVERSRRELVPPAEELIRRLQALGFRYTDRYRQRVPVEKVYGELDQLTAEPPATASSS